MNETPARRSIDEIAEAAQWDGGIRQGRDWETVEHEIGTRLPGDYKELLSRFPSGTFRDAITVVNPIDERTDFAKFLRDDIRDMLEILGDEGLEYLEGTDYRVFPEPGGLLPWGQDGQGGIFCWLTGSAGPDRWRVAYYSRNADEWREHEGPMTALVWEVLTAVGDTTILHWDFDEHLPAVFRVPSTHMGDGVWIPHPEYR